jgi:hypothetical protein
MGGHMPPAAVGYHPQAGYQPQYGVTHSMHQQLYIPEGGRQDVHAGSGPGQQAATGGLEARMKAVDKGVGGAFKGLMKKLDKKI